MAYSNNKEDEKDKLDFKTMFVLAIATSIDALAIGITFAFFEINIIKSILIIGFLTCQSFLKMSQKFLNISTNSIMKLVLIFCFMKPFPNDVLDF